MSISDELAGLTPAFALGLPAEVTRSMSMAMGHIKGVAMSTKLNAEVAEEFSVVVEPVADYLAAHRLIARGLALHRLRQVAVSSAES